MEKFTHRQYMDWLAWFEQELNNPDRTDHYLMQIAYEVKWGNVKDGKSLKLDHFKLPFKRVKAKSVAPSAKRKETKQEATARAKAIWMMRMDMAKRARRTLKSRRKSNGSGN